MKVIQVIIDIIILTLLLVGGYYFFQFLNKYESDKASQKEIISSTIQETVSTTIREEFLREENIGNVFQTK